MKLLRVGEAGAERPAVLLEGGRVVDVSSLIGDVDGAFFASGGVARLARTVQQQGERLPEVDLASERVGPPMAGIGGR